MITITDITINRFRSIISLSLHISRQENLIALCGKNNVGKTNTLRAINLFFNPQSFQRTIDMPKIKNATGGQSIFPKIDITFYDTETDKYTIITRDIREDINGNDSLSGYEYELHGKRKQNKVIKTYSELCDFLSKIEFVYIESINTFMPELISNLTNDMIDIQYNKARFTESRTALKQSYDSYVDGLQEILDSFSSEVSEVFKSFHERWNVEFKIPKNSQSVRDLISDDVILTLNDNGSEGVIDKGAGLQRLATILLNFEMLKRMNKHKQMIVCIDEPDVYLHEGLQRKLKNFFDEKSQTMQLFYTTHSKIFINSYHMVNVFLLDSTCEEQLVVRKQRNINVTKTNLVDITSENGYSQICSHLGIEQAHYELLKQNTLIVEGGCDEKYFTELGKYFGLPVPSIVALHGADNASKYLDFYESYYKNNNVGYVPKIKVIFDNDPKGREVCKRIQAKVYSHIKVKCALLQNFSNDADLSLEKNTTNNEIEDFIYPELICYLINSMLQRKNMNKISEKNVCQQISKKSFSRKGILQVCEHEKNMKNPDSGADFSFVSSDSSSSQFKDGMAGLLSIKGNPTLQKMVAVCDQKYPVVKQLLTELFDFSNF